MRAPPAPPVDPAPRGSQLDRIRARTHLYDRVLTLWLATDQRATGCNAYETITIELERWMPDGQPMLRTTVIDRGNFP
jgi:hypothetical protein